MKKVFQTVVGKGHGNCMQAAVASLFDCELEEVPNFIEYKDGWFKPLYEFMIPRGYDYEGMLHNKVHSMLMNPTSECFMKTKWHKPHMITRGKLYKEQGINELFLASVFSPKLFTWADNVTHAVIIDKDYNILHDPNPAYKGILQYPLAEILGYNGIIDVFLLNPVSK